VHAMTTFFGLESGARRRWADACKARISGVRTEGEDPRAAEAHSKPGEPRPSIR